MINAEHNIISPTRIILIEQPSLINFFRNFPYNINLCVGFIFSMSKERNSVKFLCCINVCSLGISNFLSSLSNIFNCFLSIFHRLNKSNILFCCSIFSLLNASAICIISFLPLPSSPEILYLGYNATYCLKNSMS